MPRGRNALRKPPHSLTPFRPYVSGSQDVKKMSEMCMAHLALIIFQFCTSSRLSRCIHGHTPPMKYEPSTACLFASGAIDFGLICNLSRALSSLSSACNSGHLSSGASNDRTNCICAADTFHVTVTTTLILHRHNNQGCWPGAGPGWSFSKPASLSRIHCANGYPVP